MALLSSGICLDLSVFFALWNFQRKQMVGGGGGVIFVWKKLELNQPEIQQTTFLSKVSSFWAVINVAS